MTKTLEFMTPESQWERTLKNIATTRLQIAMVITGGGTGAVSRCFRRSGASINFLEAVVPYSRLSTHQYLGREPTEGYAAPKTAQALAEVAYCRANSQGDRPEQAMGISLTASLPTHTTIADAADVKSAVAHNASSQNACIHVASHGVRDQRIWSLRFPIDTYNREASEAIAEQMFLIALRESLTHSDLDPDLDPLTPLRQAGLIVTSMAS